MTCGCLLHNVMFIPSRKKLTTYNVLGKDQFAKDTMKELLFSISVLLEIDNDR